jgi:alkylation response protein AidB-like acyl-CoA dehydrogenase
MRFGFDEEQEALRRQARRFCEEHASSAAVRRAMETAEGCAAATWAGLVELGWTALLVPEVYGGAGLGTVELAALCEETGASLLCAPLFSTVCLATPALLYGGDEAQKRRWLPEIAAGRARATLAWIDGGGETRARRDGDSVILDGDKACVVDGHTSDLLLVSARAEEGSALYAVPATAAGLTRRARPTLDATRKLADLALRGVRLPATARLGPVGGDGAALLERVLTSARIALAAEQLGGAQRCLDLTVEYAKTRVQFGRPIGSFQAVKHRLADLLVAVESARSAVYWAAWCAAVDDAELPLAAPLAHAVASETYLQAAGDAIQIHGGIGFTWEHDAHLHLKRARAAATLLGDAAAERARLARAIFPAAPIGP